MSARNLLCIILLTISNPAGAVECLLPKGCLLKTSSDTLTLYFRGHTRQFGGNPGRLRQRHWLSSARAVLTKEPYNLQKYRLRNSLFATGSSHLSLSEHEIARLLDSSGASRLILAAHSGGYAGLRKTLHRLSPKTLNAVISIFMLDNFYSVTETAKILRQKFPIAFLKERCFGYTTPHNRRRYQSHFSRLCPQTTHLKNGHHISGLRCMVSFERGEPC